tara:strand:- start:27 stop:638 length:612 start_codon:yes stop_codon:yes gene_type:complete
MSELTYDNVEIFYPKKNSDSVYYSKITLDNSELTLQIPKNKITILKDKQRCILNLDSNNLEILKNLSDIVTRKTSDNSQEWFSKSISLEDCQQIYKDAVVDEKLYGFFDENTIFYDSSKQQYSVQDLDDELNGIALIKCSLVIFTKTSFFIRWELSQFKLKKDKVPKNDVISDYIIRDLDEHMTPVEDDESKIINKLENVTLF